jgi:hypothetical protein
MSNHQKAPQEELELLHAALARALSDKIKTGEATAADLSVARQFLKDNGVESLPTGGNPIGALREQLPFPTNEQEED